uniref:Large ribosomal subunit protein mL42 n=1 Tax=Bos mutus grunniens TaxID=30521 RepID=A0A8C0A3B9_BOSMU
MALAAVKWAISSRTMLKHLFPVENGALYCVGHKSTYSSLPDDYNCKVELALTSDARTIVCYHPSVDIPYEHTKPIPRPDPVHNNEETHDLVLKTRLEEKSEHLEQGPMIEQLSKMFFTTKHRWYPRGQSWGLESKAEKVNSYQCTSFSSPSRVRHYIPVTTSLAAGGVG